MVDLSVKKRVVIKVGTSTLAYRTGRLNLRRVEKLIRVFSDLKNSGKELVFVTSGAVGVGMGRCGRSWTKPPDSMPEKQACAAIGQSELMNIYSREFSKYNHTVGQILMTRDVVANPVRRQNVVNTLNTLLSWGVVPIINANDSVSVEHLDFDENDTLSAVAAKLCGADLLVILTDVDGFYDKNPAFPGARLLPLVNKITFEMIASAKEKGSPLAKGGMLSKLEAATLVMEDDIDLVILKGDEPAVLYDLFENRARCTVFTSKGETI
ncbi:MAG: glutamate 5-kinase [Oscillospiraceae bacterium]|jgi:glutamate 5-kinase|nr:glutamate 5-kinase [Oscillospiraceae bacterium]